MELTYNISKACLFIFVRPYVYYSLFYLLDIFFTLMIDQSKSDILD